MMVRPRLSELEVKVLQLTADGRKACEIGEEIGRSKNAVDQRIHVLKNKFGAATIAGLVARAFRVGALR